MTTEKARITTVKLASDLELECLVLPDGSYGIGVSQVASVFQLDKSNATREVKALLGEGFQLDKITSELNSNPVNFITLPQFLIVCVELLAKGNKIAKKLMLIHAKTPLNSIVSSAFSTGISQIA
jgi:hypothetical protein